MISHVHFIMHFGGGGCSHTPQFSDRLPIAFVCLLHASGGRGQLQVSWPPCNDQAASMQGGGSRRSQGSPWGRCECSVQIGRQSCFYCGGGSKRQYWSSSLRWTFGIHCITLIWAFDKSTKLPEGAERGCRRWVFFEVLQKWDSSEVCCLILDSFCILAVKVWTPRSPTLITAE